MAAVERQIPSELTGRRVRVNHHYGPYEGVAGLDAWTFATNSENVAIGLKDYVGTQILDDRGFAMYFNKKTQLEAVLT